MPIPWIIVNGDAADSYIHSKEDPNDGSVLALNLCVTLFVGECCSLAHLLTKHTTRNTLTTRRNTNHRHTTRRNTHATLNKTTHTDTTRHNTTTTVHTRLHTHRCNSVVGV